MRTFLVSYDLAHPAFNKADVVSMITLSALSWARPLDNVWYIRTGDSQEDVESRLRGVISLEDGLLIQAVREDAVLMNTGLRWFRQRRVDTGEVAAHANVVAFPAGRPATAIPTTSTIKAAS